MQPFVQFVGPTHALRIFGVTMVGLDAVNLHKFIITIVYVPVLLLVAAGLRSAVRRMPTRWNPVPSFWLRQSINMVVAVGILVGLLSIWFDNPARLATGIGLASAGLAFALQKFVTSVAGYYTILSTNNFTVGDRITMGGVRGDVIALNFIQTTIMEMGQPPTASPAIDPGMWVASRQFTGRIVSVSNSMIFDSPVFNYTRDFQFIWEEIHLPITYKADRVHAEQVMLEVAKVNTLKIEDLAQPELNRLYEKFSIRQQDLDPKVYYRLTSNWIELTVRFIVRDHGIREVKDRMFRQMLDGFDRYGIEIASSTYDIVGLPPIKVQVEPPTEQDRRPGTPGSR